MSHKLKMLWHNCVIHPTIGVCYLFGLDNLASKIHGEF